MPQRQSTAKTGAKTRAEKTASKGATSSKTTLSKAKTTAPKDSESKVTEPKGAVTKGPAPKGAKARAAAARESEADLTHKFVVEAARLLSDDKCEDVVLLDVRKLSQVTDYVVIGSGTSDRQMRSVLKHVEDLGDEMGYKAFRVSADERAVWLLADFVNVVVHLFEPNTRAHYDLEMLWGDAPRVEWERPSAQSRNRAGLREGDGVAG